MAQARVQTSSAGVSIELFLDEDDVLFARRGPVQAEVVRPTTDTEAVTDIGTTTTAPIVIEVVITIGDPPA
jgi:hypothetical protein